MCDSKFNLDGGKCQEQEGNESASPARLATGINKVSREDALDAAAIRKLTIRFYSIKHRCGRDPHYRRVKFGFKSAREAAEYMLASSGALWPGATIDRINGRRGYERGNLRYATMQEQLANRRFKSREHGASIRLAINLERKGVFRKALSVTKVACHRQKGFAPCP
jgi:hypothetical protein